MRNSIRTRLIVFLIIVAVLPLLLVGLVLGWRTFRVQQQQALDLQGQIAQRVSTAVASFFQELENQLRLVVEVRGLANLPLEEQRGLLSELLTYQDAFDELALLDGDGQEQIRLSRLGTFGAEDLGSRSQADEFLVPSETRETYFSPVRFDERIAEPLLTIATPIVDPRSGEVVGVLVADARLKRIWDLIASIRVGEAESIYIVDDQGDVIAHRNPSVVLRGTTFDVPDQDGLHTGLDGMRAVLAHDRIEVGGQGFYVVAEMAVGEALSLAITNIILIAGLTVTAMVVASGVGVLLVRQIVQPVERLAVTAQSIADGELSERAEVTQRDEIGRLAGAFNTMTDRLRDLIGTLEDRVTMRTVALEHRSTQLEAAAEVGRAATSILDVDRLIRQVVKLIRSRFDLYYVGLFLVDEAGEWAVLQAGTGIAGHTMVSRNHRLEVGGTSMVGWSIAHSQPRIAQVAEEDAVRLATPELPETRAEAALPLRSRGQVIGALTIQSDRPGTFDEAFLAILQTMADQIAVAIDNAHLFVESQTALEAERRAYGELSKQAWREMLRARTGWGYRYAQETIVSAEGDWESAMEEAARTGRTVRNADEGNGSSEVVIPIQEHGEVVGVLSFRKKASDQLWNPDEIAVLEELVEQLGIALESARLYEDTQRRAARERVLGEITSRMRETLDVETVIRTAAREMRAALDLEEVEMQMGSELTSPQSDDQNES